MSTTTNRAPACGGRRVGEVLVLALAYYLFARLGLRLAYVGSSVTLIWPPTGIAIAALLRLGPRCWPGIFLGATLANAELGTPLWAAALIGAGNTAGPALVAAGLRRVGFRAFERLRDVLAFAGMAVLGMTIAPTVGLLALQRAGLVPPGFLGAAWTMWWLGDLTGALVVGPVLLTFRRAALVELRRRAAELTAVGVSALAMAVLVFAVTDEPIAFAILIPVVWGALRFPGLGSSSVVLLVGSVVVGATVSGRGQFASPDVRHGLLALSSFLATGASGNLLAMALLAEQRHAQRALETSEAARLRALAAGAVGMWDHDLRSGAFTVDEGAAALWAVPRAELERSHARFIEGIHPADRAAVLEARERALRTRTTYDVSYRVVRPDGTIRWVAGRGKYFYDDEGEPLRFAGIVQDVTAHTLSEIARRAADDRLALAARLAGFGTWEVDVATQRVTVSRELADIFGQEDLDFGTVDHVLELVHPDDRSVADEISRSLEKGLPFQAELRIRRRAGGVRDLAVHGSGAEGSGGAMVFGAALDITARKRSEAARDELEHRLMQLQKTEALGRLAGGIAHDFNNILAAILPNAELLAADLAPDHPGHELVDEIRSATLRARDLVKQILVFARERHTSGRVVDLAPVVQEAMRLLRAAIPATIEIRTDLRSCAAVVADPSQVHQIIMNLATNAQHAMSASGGVMEISLREADVDRDFAVAHAIEAGRFVVLEVRDTGHGMDAPTLARIFDPFFTTKKTGEGTGLGLSLVHAIVRSYGGAVAVRSEVGRGTTVSVYVPASAKAVAREESPSLAPRAVGGEDILLVDDEPAVRASLGRLLERLGYVVTQADSPGAALALLADGAQKFDLLLTDLTMPEMNGVALTAAAHALRPALAALVATGHGASVDAAAAAAAG
ncbi:MAG TPA: MASE1 domain-containing protein, partial [Labilithrix sp.]|nr:MASE1 domain-containing protein [Labilithrix sp.]